MAAKTLREWAGVKPVSQILMKKTALILIDIQMDYFTPGKLSIPDGESAVSQAAELRQWARSSGIPVIHIQQQTANPASPLFASGSAGVKFHPKVMPTSGEIVIQKGFPSSFRGTSLQEHLITLGIDTLILAGLMTHMCVDSTAREAIHLGYNVIIASDACATRDLPLVNGDGILPHHELHRAALTALSDRFAEVLTAAVIMELPVK